MASGPSDKAVEAVYGHFDQYTARSVTAMDHAKAALAAAHDPALGLDRSVCLRDVVEALRAGDAVLRQQKHLPFEDAADFIEREFGGTDG